MSLGATAAWPIQLFRPFLRNGKRRRVTCHCSATIHRAKVEDALTPRIACQRRPFPESDGWCNDWMLPSLQVHHTLITLYYSQNSVNYKHFYVPLWAKHSRFHHRTISSLLQTRFRHSMVINADYCRPLWDLKIWGPSNISSAKWRVKTY